jgi:putative iron-regulated protein
MKLQDVTRVALAALALGGCGDDEATEPGDTAAALDKELAAQAIENYADIVHASYVDSLAAAEALKVEIDSFLEDPSEQGLTGARDAWRAAREPYLQTEVYRFYDGPIDNADDGPEGALNAWPLDESYIDYVEGDEESGVINDGETTIDAETLLGLNEKNAEDHIMTGYHAIEFLLWGQDQSADGPGDRPYTDFVDGGTAANQDRRRQYLSVVTDLLIVHLEGLVEAWDPGDDDNYRSELLAAEPEDAVQRVLTGMIVLSGFETGGERLRVALDTEDQEDEHSCFSDNTHRDMVQDVRGIQNVYSGEYGDVSGTSLHDVIAAADDELADAIEARIAESLELAEALEPPFDQEILAENEDGQARVQALIDSLFEQEKDLEEAFDLFGFTVPDVE